MNLCRGVLLTLACLLTATGAYAQSDLKPGSAPLITPEELVKALQSGAPKPLVLNVGPRFMYDQAHITGAEYIGPGSSEQGIEHLEARAKALPKTQSIVLYCGCCPWDKCPNIRPAYDALKAMGFSKVKALYIADNFGTDWVEKGYPTAKGQ